MFAGHSILLFFPTLYLDPGSGSLLLQLLLAVLLGVGVAVRLYWSKIKQIFRGGKAETRQVSEDDQEE